MATFFDKFRKYAKTYTRERIAKQADDYGYNDEVLTSSETISGILTTKSVNQSAVTDGKSEVGYWRTIAVLYIGPEVDVIAGDVIVDDAQRYKAHHVEMQQDFKTKQSHKAVYLDKIS